MKNQIQRFSQKDDEKQSGVIVLKKARRDVKTQKFQLITFK